MKKHLVFHSYKIASLTEQFLLASLLKLETFD